MALLGAFWGLCVIGFTINQLTLFAMVLAIGIVVDDAIVVIEQNVERIMTEETPAAEGGHHQGDGQITAVQWYAITVVLAAVTHSPRRCSRARLGAIYKQFAITIAMAMGFSPSWR